MDDCNRLQDYLKKLEQWEKELLMAFHSAKCNVLLITRKRPKIIHPHTMHKLLRMSPQPNTSESPSQVI